jgi:hypothetical protein
MATEDKTRRIVAGRHHSETFKQHQATSPDTDFQRPKNTSEIRQWDFDVLPLTQKNPLFHMGQQITWWPDSESNRLLYQLSYLAGYVKGQSKGRARVASTGISFRFK